MDSLEYFAPNLSGPATRDTPFSGDQEEKDSASEEEGEDEGSPDASAELAEEVDSIARRGDAARATRSQG